MAKTLIGRPDRDEKGKLVEKPVRISFKRHVVVNPSSGRRVSVVRAFAHVSHIPRGDGHAITRKMNRENLKELMWVVGRTKAEALGHIRNLLRYEFKAGAFKSRGLACEVMPCR